MTAQTVFLVILLFVMVPFPSKAKKYFPSKGGPYLKNCDSNNECPNRTACLAPGSGRANPSAQKKCYKCNCTEQSQCYFRNTVIVCDCAENGFTGKHCDTNIDDCLNSSCLNGGTCNDGINEYTCSCAPGFTGTDCEINIDDCLASPCLNGGTCNDGVNAYLCSCAPGFTGSDCEIDIDDCLASPCLNGGACNDGVNEYTCSCAPGFTGTDCEIEVPGDACPEGWIEFEGSCYLLVSEAETWEDAKSDCESKGAYLIEITSQAENDFANKLITANGVENAWLGLNDRNVEGKLVWEYSGQTPTFFPYDAPLNSDGIDCVYAYVYNSKDLSVKFWYTFVCSSKNSYLCEQAL